MRISASGLLSTMAVAIDQILRLAPSISPPIEPVVSRTNATSTVVGLARAAEKVAEKGSAASAETSAKANAGRVITALMIFLHGPSPQTRFPRFMVPEGRQGRPDTSCGFDGVGLLDGPKSVKVHGHGIANPPDRPRPATGRPAVGDRARGRARYCAAASFARIFLDQRIAAAFGTARGSGGAERARRDLDHRDQVVGGGSARRSQMGGLPRPLRPAVLCVHAGNELRPFSKGHRPDRRRCLWRPSRLRGP